MTSCIILSAGKGSRFGSPKALALVNNDLNVIRYVQKKLLATKVDELIIVLGAEAERIKPFLLNHKKVKVVHNKDYNFGQTSSFKAGLRALSARSQAVILFPIDCPFVTVETIDEMIRQYAQKKPGILIPTFDGKKGHPPLFSEQLIPAFLGLDDSKGINSIARENQEKVVLLPVDDEGVLRTFNTREEFSALRSELTLKGLL